MNVVIVNDTIVNDYVVSFSFNETHQPVNSSFCNISSLEVYRGREQAIEINYQGISMNDSGSVEVSYSIQIMVSWLLNQTLFSDP